MRICPPLSQVDNDEILACASDRGRIVLKISFAVQVLRPKRQGRHPLQFVDLKPPMRLYLECATPDGVIALFKRIRRVVVELQEILRTTTTGEKLNGTLRDIPLPSPRGNPPASARRDAPD